MGDASLAAAIGKHRAAILEPQEATEEGEQMPKQCSIVLTVEGP
jgi:hypothetical protein